VEGCLDVDTVAACRSSGSKLISGLDSVIIELSNVEVSGSAAIALLIAWQREAARRGIDIDIRNSPDNLIDIAEACGVAEILPFS
jgi:anti-anti-sigma factor